MKIAIGIAAAGFLGALARYGIGSIPLSGGADSFPWATLFINASGSFLLGWLTGALIRGKTSPAIAEIAGTGFLGAYTTFSAFNGQLWHMLGQGANGPAAAYLLLSGIGGWWLASVGLARGRGEQA
ncbi:fluoride efflux transporter FluC [Cohnella suwonensis]|uniref:Fluoride-specific ion channel FluC n=1 Tax=Cohnella suwonensis TaxID=696072 RepID=A0ABW0LPP1_9BACL